MNKNFSSGEKLAMSDSIRLDPPASIDPMPREAGEPPCVEPPVTGKAVTGKPATNSGLSALEAASSDVTSGATMTEPSGSKLALPPLIEPQLSLAANADSGVVHSDAPDEELRLAPIESDAITAAARRRWQATLSPPSIKPAKQLEVGPWYWWPFWVLGRLWDMACLWILLAVVAAVPIVQLASLGYLLTAAANLASGKPWREALPGLRIVGRLGTYLLLSAILWLPVWLVNDLSYSAQLLQPGSQVALAWRVAACVVTGLWVVHISWAAFRGGRWWHMLWPAPVRFLKQIWRPLTWRRASDALWDLVVSLHFARLWWLGARAAVAAILWIAIPVSLMIIGLRAYDLEPAGLVGFVGAAAMVLVMLYLPFLQIQIAVENRFGAMLRLRTIRKQFRYAPMAFALSLFLLCLLCIPLYLLRIEATPAELLWAPSLVFVLFMLPAKLMLGAAMGYASNRQSQGLHIRHWWLRWPARLIGFASVLIYVGALYVAQLVAGQGALVMYFQHAYLVPAPLISS